MFNVASKIARVEQNNLDLLRMRAFISFSRDTQQGRNESQEKRCIIANNIGAPRTLQSHCAVHFPERVDGRAHIFAKVPFLQGFDSEIHLPGVIV